jgi:hypothetical protein
MANWLDQLRHVLGDYYPPDGPADVVGYLKGSGDPNVWRVKALQHKPQHMVLGSVLPTREEWEAAGKPGQDAVQTIRPKDLDGFIILYSGVMIRTPWGRIELLDADALKYYQSSTIDSFTRNLPKRGH